MPNTGMFPGLSEHQPFDHRDEKLNQRSAQERENHCSEPDRPFKDDGEGECDHFPDRLGNHQAEAKALMQGIHELVNRGEGKPGLDISGHSEGGKQETCPKDQHLLHRIVRIYPPVIEQTEPKIDAKSEDENSNQGKKSGLLLVRNELSRIRKMPMTISHEPTVKPKRLDIPT